MQHFKKSLQYFCTIIWNQLDKKGVFSLSNVNTQYAVCKSDTTRPDSAPVSFILIAFLNACIPEQQHWRVHYPAEIK